MARPLILQAIDNGVPAYNAGQIAACASTYAQTAQVLLDNHRNELSASVAQMLEAGLRSPAVNEAQQLANGRQQQGSAVDKLAWSLREAFDLHLASPQGALTTAATTRTASSTVDALITAAISKGVPAYNRGDPNACQSIYATAVKQLIARYDLPLDTKQRLAAVLNECSESPLDPDGNAWKLRRVLDSVVASRSAGDAVDERRVTRANSSSAAQGIIRNFSMDIGLELRTSCVNDTVMGGRSNSAVEKTADGIIFKGSVTRRGGGGFVSVRFEASDSRAFVQTLRGGSGISCKVCCIRGCSAWKLQLNEGRNGVQWQSGFNVPSTESASAIRIPYTAFVPTWRGSPQRGRGLTDADLQNIQAVGFMLSFLEDDGSESRNFQEGDFALLVNWISVF